MLRLIRALMQDPVCWGMVFLLAVVVLIGLTTIFERYEKFERYRNRLVRMEYDIIVLKNDLDKKQVWVRRLESDPTAWEQVAREKMNYLGPDELLVTFVAPEEKTN